VLEVSSLLRALALELDMRPDGSQPPPDAAGLQRERRLSALILDECAAHAPCRSASTCPPTSGCAHSAKPCSTTPGPPRKARRLARDSGASPRTIARLFRSELGTSFVQWRHQVLLARAVTLAARKLPMASIASELGYASPSAFSAMVRRSVGAPPRSFFGS